MSSPRERLTTALEGGTPDITPYSIYSWMMNRETERAKSAWRSVLDQGLALCHHCNVVRHIEHGVTHETREEKDGADTYTIYTRSCPAGTLRMVRRNGWHHEDWIKTPADYDIRRWMIEHTEVQPVYEQFEVADAEVGEQGVPVVTGSRTPLMSINIDWAGTEQFCLDLALEVPELFALYEAQRKLFLEETRLIAAGPGRFVKWFENLTINMIGPRRYRELLVPVYEEAVPLLEAGGKRVMTHYDGELRCIADDIAAAPMHMIESLTEAPEGDMRYEECRAAWPDKVLWAHLNVDLYQLPEAQLRAAVVDKRQRGGKRGFAFEISEDLQAGWEQSVPIVLQTLEELG
ncbi:MAG: hypothetical protein HUU35_01850 [Armatimonadetes bacterium]|nr:hypothetical protein [Armatimonadota bacterium]